MNPQTIEQQSTILIVDDHESSVELLKALLTSFGYSSIYSTMDSREASKMYSAIRPDLVLLDLHMPHMDGFQVMKQLKELEKESYAPILILTSQNDKDIRLKALKEGATDILNKPLNLAEVMFRIQNILEIRLLHRRVRDQNKAPDQKVREHTEELNQSR